jgi:cytochrome c-type biogenesis protein CcmH
MTRVRLLVTSACAFALLLFLCTVPAHAVDPTQMPTPQLEARYLALTHQFRCPVCEDETLADSDEPYAAEVRQQIRSMLLAGDSDRQIRDFLVSRYTAFITFKPAYSLRNAWLWLAPFVLLAIGLVIAARIIRARSALVAEDVAPVDDDLILEPDAESRADARAEARAAPIVEPRARPAIKSASPR